MSESRKSKDKFKRFEKLEGEELRIIKGYEDYAITNYSRVISLKKNIVLKTRIDDVGYVAVRLCKNKVYKQKRVHRLVAEYFIPNPDNLPQVNHIDGVKSNPSINNLEWVDGKGNTQHALKAGLLKIGERHHAATITEKQAQSILDDYKSGIPIDKIIHKHNYTSKCVINKICHRTRWKHLS